MGAVGDLKARIDELAEMMDEYGLEQAEIKGDCWAVEFDRRGPAGESTDQATSGKIVARPAKKEQAEPPTGTPVTSPMIGIFYTAPNPGAEDYVAVGDQVTAGQVVGLIEAMKVYNEITAPVAGTVTSIAADNGQLVQPGDALIYIG